MTFVEDVQRARNPREAMLNLAAGLDVLVERIDKLESTGSWDEWGEEPPITITPTLPAPTQRAPTQRAPTVVEHGDSTEVIIPPPTPEKAAQRRMFEQQSLQLTNYLGTDHDWTEVYVAGGPQWLYAGNRELVMSLPRSTRQAMVADLDEDSHQQAIEMSRDILKEESTGIGDSPALADEFAGGVSGIRGTG